MGTVTEAGGVEARPANLGVQRRGDTEPDMAGLGAGGIDGVADREKMKRDSIAWVGSEDRNGRERVAGKVEKPVAVPSSLGCDPALISVLV